MPVNSVGIVTARDSLTIHYSRDGVVPIVRDFAELPSETARNKYRLGRDAQDWKIHLAQARSEKHRPQQRIGSASILYRPFDTRYTYYTGNARGFICQAASSECHAPYAGPGENLGLITSRRIETQDAFDRIFVTESISDGHIVTQKEISYLYPLYTFPAEQQVTGGLYAAGDREPNLAPGFTDDLAQRTGLTFIPDGPGDLQETFGPEDVFHYIYAVFHSPTYRERYDQFLRADFPRVPPPGNFTMFRELAGLGLRLVEAHLLRSEPLSATPVSFPVPGDNVVAAGYPKYAPGDADDDGRVYINLKQYFAGVAPAVWEFRIGGYQPMDKWLKDRRRRALSPYDDLKHYGRMAAAIAETNTQMSEIDGAIENAGGLFG